MSNLAIIPARGGSKRIPRKNIKDFLGKPIIAYSIQAAIDSQLFDEIIVSTDDEEIAEVAIQYGAKVPFMRSTEKSNDFATLASVVLEVENSYQQQNKVFENIVTVLSTAPFVSGNILKKAHSHFTSKNYDSLLSVVEYSRTLYRSFQFDHNSHINFNFPEYLITRSQDLPISYIDAGQFYFSKISFIKENNRLTGGKCFPYIFNECDVQDIDSPEDWTEAELKFKNKR